VLSWSIEDGRVEGTNVSGLPVAIASRYSDDEPGSPWSWILYLDEDADESQRSALEEVFTGRLGGDALKHFPWAWKESRLLAVRPAEIALDHTRRRQWLRVRDEVSVSIRDRYATPAAVTCVIPGHHRDGEELVTDMLQVQDDSLAFDFHEVCGYGSSFDYAG
jgi:hypothetical protein